MDGWRSDRIGSAERGENPMVLARLRSGFAVLGDTQFLPGYCLPLACPRAPDLGSLSLEARAAFLLDMSLLGDAVAAACGPDRVRTNDSIYGNTDRYLHAHVFPRYAWEPDERRPYPVWQYPADRWRSPAYAYSEGVHGALRRRLAEAVAAAYAGGG